MNFAALMKATLNIMKNILVILLAIVSSCVSPLSAQTPGGKSDSYCTFAGKKGGNISKKKN